MLNSVLFTYDSKRMINEDGFVVSKVTCKIGEKELFTVKLWLEDKSFESDDRIAFNKGIEFYDQVASTEVEEVHDNPWESVASFIPESCFLCCFSPTNVADIIHISIGNNSRDTRSNYSAFVKIKK